jgi:hypothetical protein
VICSLSTLSSKQPATKKGGVVIYQVGTDDIITEATKHLSDKLKIKHGKDKVMVVEKDKEGFLKPQNNTNTSELKEGYKVKIIGTALFSC